MKKVLSVFVALCLLVSLVTVSFAGYKEEAKLQFNEDGNFKIMVLADVQDEYPMNASVIEFIGEALDYAQPDIVVFNGDNIVTDDPRAIEQLVTPLVERNVPFTLVYGNHDDDSGWAKEDQLVEYQKYAGCLAYDADPDIHGCATHNLPILSSDGSKVAFNLWMFDSGSDYYDENGKWLGYDWVRADQIEWYNTVRDEMTAENGGELVPSIAFQHIIPQEPCETIYYPSPFSLGEATINFIDGSTLSVIPDITKYEGYVFEKSCPSYGNDGQWDALVAGGDVLGLVVGHDHVNSFVVDCDGVDLIQTPGVTYHSYSNDMLQGARIIEINENDPWNYTTSLLTTSEMALQDDSILGDLGDRSQANYFVNYYFEKIFAAFYNILKAVVGDMFAM